MQVHEHNPFQDAIFKRGIPTDIAVRNGEFDNLGGSCAAYKGVNEDSRIVTRLYACRLWWIERGTIDYRPIQANWLELSDAREVYKACYWSIEYRIGYLADLRSCI